MTLSIDPGLDTLRAEVAELLEVSPSELGVDDSLFDHGMDSMRLMHLVEGLEARGVEVGFVELATDCSLRRLHELTR